MRYAFNRARLVAAFCERFPIHMSIEHCRNDSSPDANLPQLVAMWGAFLDSLLSLGLIDEDARDEWVKAPPKREILDEIAALRQLDLDGDLPLPSIEVV